MARWIPHQLNYTHNQVRVNICESLLFQPNRKEFFEDLVTHDESCILYGNIARDAVWPSCDAETPAQLKPDLRSPKHLLPFWWDTKGPIR
ncbi:hypothetical protein OESDEN_17433 [Oesophagostomum dentatum]|uniref:Uncharacterized protein n=1 Tax=Oesophagostomum dentatum TaxID=61180 RepID=A0A0B1SH42_OESDE|nr:hypothetical protein OESDEN_17433 [Oesophagostomum dentatum]